MAVHGQPEPPRTLAAWHRFQEECWRQQRYEWAEVVRLDRHPAGFTPSRWEFTAEDHPFKGTQFCWRCLAEASGGPIGEAQHCRRYGVICWGPPTAANSTEDREQDGGPPGDESTSDWTEAGRRYVAEGVDTGTFFYSSPPEPPPPPRGPVIHGSQVWLTPLDPEGNPTGPRQKFTGSLPATEVEPADEDVAKWTAQPRETPFSPDWSSLYRKPPEADQP